jgi:deferrochelatase/peroxidase EfeB
MPKRTLSTPDQTLSPPLPGHGGPFQAGITDPIWPAEPPAGIDRKTYADLYAGQLERQRHLHIVTADVTVGSRAELGELLAKLTAFARHQMDKPPSQQGWRAFDPPIPNRRVTITIGFGATLFTTAHGDDRLGIAALKPASLKIMPEIDGDEGFLPRDHATDLVILVASDDVYVNEYIFGRLYYGGVHPGIAVRKVERGYARPDSREPSGFEDGVSNPRELPPDHPMRHLVYVREEDDEPAWCVHGTYLAYRKIRRRLRGFFALAQRDREAVFGVDAHTGLREDKQTGIRKDNLIPNPHAPKMNPRRNHPDLFGINDDSRRFLRRPYFYNDGVDASGEEARGVHHISFVRNLAVQYEWPVLMWQMNPDFPHPGAGRDALYDAGGAANVGGGYYFLPPAPHSKQDHLGSALLA